MSVLLKDRLEGIITNDLSEGLEGDGVNDITVESGGNFHGNSLNLIDRNAELLGGKSGILGSDESLLLWWLSVDLLIFVMVLVMMLVVVLAMVVLVMVLA